MRTVTEKNGLLGIQYIYQRESGAYKFHALAYMFAALHRMSTEAFVWLEHFAPFILGDPGADGRVDKMSVVIVYCKIETSPWAITLTEPVPEAVELPASDWPESGAAG